MGVSQLPRIYFNGYNYWTPSTFNNNDYDPPIDTYDPPNAKLNWNYLHSQGVYDGSEFKKWAEVPIPYKVPQDKVPPAEWGYYGGNQCGFVTSQTPNIQNPDFSKPQDFTHVTGYTDVCGNYHDAGDSWLNQALQFNVNNSPAKLVDVNPTAFWSSQIFADSFTLGTPADGFTAPVVQRMYSRWVVFRSHNYNVSGELIIAGTFSAVFQTCFEKNAIQFHGEGSRLQAELQQALEADEIAGLMLRFTSYDTLYFQGKVFDGLQSGNLYPFMQKIAELYREYTNSLKAYQDGKSIEQPIPPVNRAYSRSVGWVGLWEEGEMVSVPGGRFLIPFDSTGKEITVQAKGLPDGYYKPQQNPDGTPEPPQSQVPLGPAAVEVEAEGETVSRLTVDLGTAMPLYNISGKKADFGQVQLAVMSEGQPQPIADLPNDQESYIKTAGVVDITDIPPELAALIPDNPLAITVETYNPSADTQERIVGLLETPLTAQTDQRGVYVEEPNPSWEPDDTMSVFTIKVQYYDGTPPDGTTVALAESDASLNPVTDPKASFVKLFYKDNGEFKPYTAPVPVQNGRVTIGVQAERPGMPNIAFEPALPGQSYSGPAFNPPGIASAFYTVIRCLPFQNAMAEEFEAWLKTNPDVRQVNDRVFAEVFGTYHLMYRVMDFINSPLKFQEWRGRILSITDPSLFESAAYMPVTRALSAGQRRILELYATYLSGVLDSPLTSRKKTQLHPGQR